MLVIGSVTSSNTNRLLELANNFTTAYLIDSKKDIQADWLVSAQTVGITAGASAPKVLIDDVVDFLQQQLHCTAQAMTGGIVEKVEFFLPKELRLLPL